MKKRYIKPIIEEIHISTSSQLLDHSIKSGTLTDQESDKDSNFDIGDDEGNDDGNLGNAKVNPWGSWDD